MEKNTRENVFRQVKDIAPGTTMELNTYKEGEEIYTTGFVTFKDYYSLSLGRINLSRNEHFIWTDKYVFKLNSDNLIDKRVLDIDAREYIDINLDYNQMYYIRKLSVRDCNSSIAFNKIYELSHGNRLFVNEYWNDDGNLINEVYLIDKKNNVSSIPSICVCSCKDEYSQDSYVFDEKKLYEFWIRDEHDNIDDNEIIIQNVYDMSTGKFIRDEKYHLHHHTQDDEAVIRIKELCNFNKINGSVWRTLKFK